MYKAWCGDLWYDLHLIILIQPVIICNRKQAIYRIYVTCSTIITGQYKNYKQPLLACFPFI